MMTEAQLVGSMDMLQGYAFRLTRSADGRDDLSQATALQAWEKRHLFSGDVDAARRWVCTIARNLFFDSFRRKSVVAVFSLEDVTDGSNPADDFNGALAVPPPQEHVVAARQLAGVVGAEGATLLLDWHEETRHRGDGMPRDSVDGRDRLALRYGVKPGTISSRVHRLRIAARLAYGEDAR